MMRMSSTEQLAAWAPGHYMAASILVLRGACVQKKASCPSHHPPVGLGDQRLSYLPEHNIAEAGTCSIGQGDHKHRGC